MTVFTIGHSTRSAEEFVALLREAGVDHVVDVRRFPFSRRYPHFNGEALAATLAAAGIGYRHEPALGGRRGRRRDGAPSPHTLWREQAFANYADYAETPEFRAALETGVLRLARDHRPAVMCAEAVWWRCHRRIIADYLLAQGVSVMHIMGSGKVDPAKLTPGAHVLTNGTLVYPAAEEAIKTSD
jgi:uncharacterized protein (DUF488 family)